MAFYEITYIVRATLPKAEMDKITERFTSIVTKGGGNVVKNEYWGLRQLAYPIQKSAKGHYIMLGIEASADTLLELERDIRFTEEVVRNLTVRVDAIESEPSAVIRERSSEYGDRDRGDRAA